jgi:hypothetical protein
LTIRVSLAKSRSSSLIWGHLVLRGFRAEKTLHGKSECVGDKFEKDKGEGEPPPVGMDLSDSNHAVPVENAHPIQDDGRQD